MGKKRGRESILKLSLVIALYLLPTFTFAAMPEEGNKKVTLDLKSVSIKDFFNALRQQTDLSFVYNTEQTKSLKPVTIRVVNETVENVLESVFEGTGFTYVIEKDIVTISRLQQKKRVAIGVISDTEGEPLPGANIVIRELKRFAISDNDGKYSIEIPSGPCTLTVSYIGVSTQVLKKEKGTGEDDSNILM